MNNKDSIERKKTFLKTYINLQRAIDNLEMQLKEIREEKESAGVQKLTDMPHGNKKTDLSDYMVRLEEIETKLKKKQEQKKNQRLKIQDAIFSLENDVESDIMYKHYIFGMAWDSIAIDLNKSVRQVQRIHGNALKNIKI